jgi:hypothetical protein
MNEHCIHNSCKFVCIELLQSVYKNVACWLFRSDLDYNCSCIYISLEVCTFVHSYALLPFLIFLKDLYLMLNKTR